MTDQALTDRHLSEWAWFVIAVGAVLRFQGLDWDQGLLLNPDERNIATAAARLVFPDDLVPQFHAYNGLALYLPRLLAEAISPWTERNGSDTVAIVFAGRLLSAFYATLALPVLWSIGRRALGMEAGLLVVGCAAASPALIQAAHFATTESGLVLCLVATVWLSMRHISGGLPLSAYAVLTGFVIGLGFALKTTALVFAICPIVAVTITTLSRRQFWPAFNAGIVALALLGAMALATTPQIWATPQAYFETMRFESAVVSGTADVFWTYQFAGARNGLFEISQLPWLVGPALAPLGLAGLGALLFGLWRRNPRALSLAAAAGFTVVYALIICSWHAKFVRYLTLLVPMLILFAGYFAMQISGDRLRRGIMIVTAIATAATGIMQAAIYQVTDPRIAAWEWLLPRLKAGDQFVIEPVDLGPPYGVPQATPVETSVLPLIEPSSPAKLDKIGDILEGGNWMIVASRRHHDVLPRLRGRFPEMCGYYDALWSGRLGYVVVGKFRRRPVLPAALEVETQAEESLTVFDSPVVFVFAKSRQIPAASIVEEIQATPPSCRK